MNHRNSFEFFGIRVTLGSNKKDMSFIWLNFGILDMSSWQNIQFLMRGSNLRSKNAKFESQEGKNRKD